jgi:hypothetical protein
MRFAAIGALFAVLAATLQNVRIVDSALVSAVIIAVLGATGGALYGAVTGRSARPASR